MPTLTDTNTDTALPPGLKRRFITLISILLPLLEMLDVTVVNLVLPNIRGALSARVSTLIWTITAYITGSILSTPLTGFFTKLVGRRAVLTMTLLCFIAFSVLCAISTNIYELIVFRALQGFSGGLMIPLAEPMLLGIYPKEEYKKAMAFFGLGVMLGPILGAVLGGLVATVLSWRWVFLINVPLGLITLLLVLIFVKDTKREKTPINLTQIILMGISLISIELLLSQGNQQGWFYSNYIIVLFAVFIIALLLFLWRSIATKSPSINLKIFRDWHFSSAALTLFAAGLPILGSLILIPLLLHSSFHYSILTIAELLLLRGIFTIIGVPLAAVVSDFIDPRILLAISFFLTGLANWLISSLSLTANITNLYWPLILQGLSSGMLIALLFGMAFSTISSKTMDEASGLFNLCRSIGFSIGATLAITFFDGARQRNWSYVSSKINIFNPHLKPWLAKQHLSLHSKITPSMLHGLIDKQASFMAYITTFRVIAAISFFLIILAFFLGKYRGRISN